MLFQLILLDNRPTFCGPFAFDDVSDPIVVIDKVRGLKFTCNLNATISIPSLDGYVIITESDDDDDGGGINDDRASRSPSYVYCVPVPDHQDSIREADILSKIGPWLSFHEIGWRLKCLKHLDGQLVAETGSYTRGTILSLYKDGTPSGVGEVSGDGAPINEEDLKGGLSNSKRRDMLTVVPHHAPDLLKSDVGVTTNHRSSNEALFIGEFNRPTSNFIEPSSDCIEDVCQRDGHLDVVLPTPGSDNGEGVPQFYRSRSFPCDNGCVTRTPSNNTSLPNDLTNGDNMSLITECGIENAPRKQVLAVKAKDIPDNGVPGGPTEPVLVAPIPTMRTEAPSSLSSSSSSSSDNSCNGIGDVTFDTHRAFDSTIPKTDEDVLSAEPRAEIVEDAVARIPLGDVTFDTHRAFDSKTDEDVLSAEPRAEIVEDAVARIPLGDVTFDTHRAFDSKTPKTDEDAEPCAEIVEDAVARIPPDDASMSNEGGGAVQEISGEPNEEEKEFVYSSPASEQQPQDSYLVSARPYFYYYLDESLPNANLLPKCSPDAVLYAATEEIYGLDYTSRSLIKGGGYGVVYSCGEYALKETQYRKEELDIMKELRHVNIIPLYGVILIDPHNRLIYQVMPLMSCDLRKALEGVCLKKISANRKPHFRNCTICNMKYLFLNILEPLHYLHDLRISHSDIKEDNILIKMCTCESIMECGCLQKFKVYLADFNTVCRIDTTSRHNRQGTPQYMSPEACGGYRTLANDIWSVGVIMCHCCLGTENMNTHLRATNILMKRDPHAKLDIHSTIVYANILLKDLSQAAREDEDLKKFASFAHRCYEEDNTERATADDLIKDCADWGNAPNL